MSTPDGFLSFHEDELRAQTLAGERAGRAAIRPFMPPQHREFFPLLPYLFTATLDEAGAPLASMLWGPAGFVHSPDPVTLRLDALPGSGDPAAGGFAAGQPIGLLGLDLSTRRRNRANGRNAARDGTGLSVAVEQSFGNCAQYIQTRFATPHARPARATETLSALDAPARRLIETADTFFVASRSRTGIGDGGLDMSHRGGRPGFAAAEGDTLVVPDFRGNRFFNTLGNLLGDPRAGLLFVDFATGDLLQLQGTVTIDWSGEPRRWRVAVERGWRRPAALPFDWRFGDFAPTTLATPVG
ncbi:MAG: pyridoxamine 5'-phosphate oxidase family protein [Reyranella sp.]|uniref:pyridoxamine 5'-phosphate oxidase family protein n=1 Tax=Reyranella sp. TaxID=1929291 RepID=UPI001AC8BCAC|nr:pyridoxamine 5'-phosphate oxidase family protein [Reyranella sp.]MBN9085652.1 pyridoxamine 5'-phosphate oxidase family protein [Reyranella sp.]